eukprot:jgi/Mesvir1/25396/Mv01434-RA.1
MIKAVGATGTKLVNQGFSRVPNAPKIGALNVEITKASGKPLFKAATSYATGDVLKAFCRAEARGVSSTIKDATSTVTSVGLTLEWNQTLFVPVYDDSMELRIMLCVENSEFLRPRCFAAAAIRIRDVIEAGEVQQNFDFFTPTGANAGKIPLKLTFVPNRR